MREKFFKILLFLAGIISILIYLIAISLNFLYTSSLHEGLLINIVGSVYAIPLLVIIYRMLRKALEIRVRSNIGRIFYYVYWFETLSLIGSVLMLISFLNLVYISFKIFVFKNISPIDVPSTVANGALYISGLLLTTIAEKIKKSYL